MSITKRLPLFVWRLLRFLPPRLAYHLGLGSLVGRSVLLLKTVGRKSGLTRITPLLYDKIDGSIYVLSARGRRADWYRNLEANPDAEIIIGSETLKAHAELVTDLVQIVNLLEHRLAVHPRMMRAVLRAQGLKAKPKREHLEAYAKKQAIAAVLLWESAY